MMFFNRDVWMFGDRYIANGRDKRLAGCGEVLIRKAIKGWQNFQGFSDSGATEF